MRDAVARASARPLTAACGTQGIGNGPTANNPLHGCGPVSYGCRAVIEPHHVTRRRRYPAMFMIIVTVEYTGNGVWTGASVLGC